MTFATKQDFRDVETIVAEAHSSFSMGMKLLPPERRGYLFGIYAYCRVLDDIADEDFPIEQKIKQLNEWQNKVEAIRQGKPNCAITRILCDAKELFQIPTEELDRVIEGMRADVNGPIYGPTWAELYEYCRNVAVSVGLLSLPVFGRSDETAQNFGIELGYALQLTNILRDVVEDSSLGRLYLPKESLEAQNVPDITSPKLYMVLEEVAEKTESHYKKAETLLIEAGSLDLQPAIIMMTVYRKLFEKMKKRGWQVCEPRMRLSKMEKVLTVSSALARL